MAFNMAEFVREWWNRVTVAELARDRREREQNQCDDLADDSPCGRLMDDEGEGGDAFHQLDDRPPDC